jgi:hypothetical protein
MTYCAAFLIRPFVRFRSERRRTGAAQNLGHNPARMAFMARPR